MDKKEKKLLFRALSWTLSNQQKIMRHLGITQYDNMWGWDDNELETVTRDCDSIGYSPDEEE